MLNVRASSRASLAPTDANRRQPVGARLARDGRRSRPPFQPSRYPRKSPHPAFAADPS
ncbi:hypothetical protein C4K05_4348 [Pseudomonas chlororaphis subsp. aureofaciens]|uniref:Uncharacterized protein n=1 Tax=Pseudomonas chlororaphis subsp. aureofaciens TaxID=587851 RepID=A0AAD0ZGP3_9PSED|nr:hypothetical protein C4K11_4119 [Pseudomonas chlororaphis subsp. aureofaciens]AZE24766.1 hypothetical protein C4K08_4348 [Pseudomonas chlororaphis subsp. aureofaciens]AZE30967.1 hypothetical protein C4K07_4191 [Pseudomonas chlororaphis subsp. aureofaciens]AZE37282.1 hypothetical protein C4K06_4258 [Pseudomonas chlororaphis subsp. aureofaciens]AZE43679.1 hypothetical protein C4K05_4348 [Pseudomonas chlororaphis subsp. aureofaciens]